MCSDTVIELFQELELFHLVDRFFNRAIYYSSLGYERAIMEMEANVAFR